MTPEQRAAARARCKAVPPGPWRAMVAKYLRADKWCVTRPSRTICIFDATETKREKCATFIAHARTDLPAALDALDAADARIAELEELARSLSERVAKQSELLSRRAEVQKP